MREIKFRAWDKRKKEWYGKSSADIPTWYGFHIFGECTLEMPPVGYMHNLEITQCIGMKDRDGEDI